jgi:hypothetical protein
MALSTSCGRHFARLEGQNIGQAPAELFASSNHELFARGVDLAIAFDGTKGVETTMKFRRGETERRAVRASDAKARDVLAS